MEQEEIMKKNRKHKIAEPLTLFALFGSLASPVETGERKFIDVQVLVPNFVNGRLKSYEIGKPILNASGCETDNETGYEIGDEKSVRISITSIKGSGEDLLFEGVSDDDYNVRIYISRVNNKILKSLRFS